ncbi:MAG TPA: glycoside hydrolase family 2 protein [Terracidiphilus sp.]|nr:glycoside hydrolase family 2 protein [Terracidiphilus sp.]
MRKAVVKALVGIAVFAVIGTGCRAGLAETVGAQNTVLNLDHGWQFRQASPREQEPEQGWLPATVPGDVHLDLLANKRIPDPFFRDNESKLQWIEQANWEYQDSFDVPSGMLGKANVDLVFDGLDAAAEVYLNDVHVLSANNMFRIWRVPVKDHLRAGMNVLRIEFPSPIKAAEKVAAADPWQVKTHTAPQTYIRKAAYEFGWDWGPRFATSGIWRPVRLEGWDKVRIADFAIRQRDVSKEVAHIDAQVLVQASTAGAATVTVSYNDAGKPVVLTTNAELHAGANEIDIPVEIRQPKLWYPVGYGGQPLYEFSAQTGTGASNAEERKVKVGLRSVALDRHPDKWGRSFQFLVNGIPVFAKGADVIPFDSFPNRVTTADYRSILESARDANMNMIRHWGGGYYETDEFYSICDELGIMVWQDFMFGNDWQPGTYDFKLNIEAEAEDQVRRLRNHPSIVLWSGNNETEIAFNWRQRPTLPPDVKLQMWQDYLTEFSGILNRVVARLNPETPYWPSSPSADYEKTSAQFESGDTHTWDVWHGNAPFSAYDSDHSRFVSEFGFQSFPEMRTIERFTLPEDRANIFTPVMQSHQKAGDGNAIIRNYILRDYAEPRDFASFVYISQVLQAEGIKRGVEHFRRSMPETMGSIFWQLNDCWPVASWSSIDYYGRWKALQYYARRFYAPLMVSPHVEDGAVKVYIVSDKTEAQKATLRVRLMGFDGKVLLEEKRDISVEPLTSKMYLEWPISKLMQFGASDTSRVFVAADLITDGTQISRNLTYLVPTKEAHLIPAHLAVEAKGETGKYKITVSSPVLARDVYLSFGKLDARISDNYFDLLPGELVEVGVESNATLDQLKAEMSVKSLTDAFAPESAGVTTAAH